MEMEIKNLYYHIVVLRIMGLFFLFCSTFFVAFITNNSRGQETKDRKAGLEPNP